MYTLISGIYKNGEIELLEKTPVKTDSEVIIIFLNSTPQSVRNVPNSSKKKKRKGRQPKLKDLIGLLEGESLSSVELQHQIAEEWSRKYVSG